jgi:hypothetical protein
VAVATDVPSKYDVVINAKGYTFLRTLDGSYLSAGRHRAEYTSSPTFVERQNVSNAYGDNAQDFFLTARQRDWSKGEQQKFFRNNADGLYWAGANIDVSVQGQAQLAPSVKGVAVAGSVLVTAPYHQSNNAVVVASSTNLYDISSAGTATDHGAHGLGAAPSIRGMVTDANGNVFLSTTTAGTVGVRKWTGGVFSTFSATACDSLAFLNNTLYGARINSSGDLIQYDTAGVATSLFSWKDAVGTGANGDAVKLRAFGGKLLILRHFGASLRGELWIYDGSSCRILEDFPPDFDVYDVEVVYGVAYISGAFQRVPSSLPAVLFYDGAQVGVLWRANAYTSGVTPPALTAHAHGLLFTDDTAALFADPTAGAVMLYNPALGGVSTVASYTVAGDRSLMSATRTFAILARGGTTCYMIADPALTATSGYVISSLIDFDSSLTKTFRGVKVEFASAVDGDGGSVDIAYQIDSLSGSWTTLKTGATSGTEYTLTSVSGHAIAIKITLNKGTSTVGPVLKNTNVRAAPVVPSFKYRTYNLDLSSTLEHPTVLQDGSNQPLTGFAQAQNLLTAISSSTPIVITDKFGTFTGVCEPANCSILELHSDSGSPTTPGQYVATIVAREI